MNTITHNTASFDFSCLAELLSTPLVRAFTDNPQVTHFGCDGKLLLAYHGTKFCDVVGRLNEPVHFPKGLAIKRTSQLDQ